MAVPRWSWPAREERSALSSWTAYNSSSQVRDGHMHVLRSKVQLTCKYDVKNSKGSNTYRGWGQVRTNENKAR